MLGDARVLVFDEPTAPLTGHEIGKLFSFIEQIRAQNVGVVYISHHLDEVFRIADRVTVLRDGRTVATSAVADTSKAQVIEWMVGRSVLTVSRVKAVDGPVRMQAEVRPKALPQARLDLRAGEIVGLVGIIGSGRNEFCRALAGVNGESTWTGLQGEGHSQEVRSLAAALKSGIGFLPEDRKHEGAVLDGTIGENISLSSLAEVSRLGVLDAPRERSLVQRWMKDLHIRPQNAAYLTGSLSGGNQQKVVLGRVLAAKPQVLILEEPTRGVDIGAREEIYGVIADLARTGLPIVLSSGDAAEVVGLAQRILVFQDGRIVHELHAPTTLEEVIAHVTGAV